MYTFPGSKILIIIIFLALFGCGGGGSDSEDPVITDNIPQPVPGSLCPALSPVSDGLCELTTGTGNALRIQGNILLTDSIKANAEVLIEDGVITCTGCDCGLQAKAVQASTLRCPQGLVTPGLINSQSHTSYNSQAPVANTTRYNHRHNWRSGTEGFPAISFTNGGTADIQWDEIRQVMSGTTSIIGGNTTPGMVRNLHSLSASGMTHPNTNAITFPLGDLSGQTYLDCSSYPWSVTPADIETSLSSYLTIAEGVNATAENEFRCIASLGINSQNFLLGNANLSSAIAVNALDVDILASQGGGLVWTPRSDTSLYGMTTPIPMVKQASIDIALGTYWTLTGSSTLIREMSCAQDWNNRWGGGLFDAQGLFDMVTRNSARMAGYDDVLGSLETGKLADVVLWDARGQSDMEAVFGSNSSAVALVLRGGVVLYGDSTLVAAMTGNGDCETLDVCGAAKQLCANREFGTTYASLASSLITAYPAFFCTTPTDEPTCIPSRSGYTGIATLDDTDGDGIANVSDNCPTVFNPPLPFSNDNQADTDGDGTGDLCEHLVTQANTNFHVDWCKLQQPARISAEEGNQVTVSAQLFINGLTTINTSGNDPDTHIIAALGYGADGSSPTDPSWTWVTAAPDDTWSPVAENQPGIDQYHATMTVPASAGSYDYAFRFSGDSGSTWTYCDTVGSANGYQATEAGDLSVTQLTRDVYFQEYIEGSGLNKAIEIFNGRTTSLDLSTCEIRLYSNGSATATSTIVMSGTLAPSSVYAVCNTGLLVDYIGNCDQLSSTLSFNGDDAVELACDSTVLDVIGQTGTDPGLFWGTEPVTTLDHTLRRNCNVTAGDTDGSNTFDPATEWTAYAIDTLDGLGLPGCTQ